MTYYVEQRRTYGRLLFCVMTGTDETAITVARCDAREYAFRIAELLNNAATATVAPRKGGK